MQATPRASASDLCDLCLFSHCLRFIEHRCSMILLSRKFTRNRNAGRLHQLRNVFIANTAVLTVSLCLQCNKSICLFSSMQKSTSEFTRFEVNNLPENTAAKMCEYCILYLAGIIDGFFKQVLSRPMIYFRFLSVVQNVVQSQPWIQLTCSVAMLVYQLVYSEN